MNPIHGVVGKRFLLLPVAEEVGTISVGETVKAPATTVEVASVHSRPLADIGLFQPGRGRQIPGATPTHKAFIALHARSETPSRGYRSGNLLVSACDRETAALPLTARESPVSDPSSTKPSAKTDSWENEGGSVTPFDLAMSLGVTRQMTETYSVGSYRYTNLTDAIAQARRMAKLESQLL